MSNELTDWSAQTIPDGSIDLLDPDAIRIAKLKYLEKHHYRTDDVDNWSDIAFLKILNLLTDSGITYAAMVLLGKEEYSDLIPNSSLHIRWIFNDDNGLPLSGNLFHIPFLLSVESLCEMIHNSEYSDFRKNALPVINEKIYNDHILHELLYNAIMNQDYTKEEIITVTEYNNNRIVFINAGEFYSDSVEEIILSEAPYCRHRNERLSSAMEKIGIVNCLGTGIKSAFREQINRTFSLPDYELSAEHVKVTIYGKITYPDYSEALQKSNDLQFYEIVILDRIAKGLEVNDYDAISLCEKGLIGKLNRKFVILGSEYAKNNRTYTGDQYRELILDLIQKNGSATRAEIAKLLNPLYPRTMNDKERSIKTTSLLIYLKKSGKVTSEGPSYNRVYKLSRQE